MGKIIFISGLSHSGSTLLDLILGGHPHLIGLGEIARVFESQDIKAKTCSCGETAEKCIFWSQVLPRLASIPKLDLKQKYEIVCENFSRVFGDDYIMVDSSKYLKTLNFLDTEFDFDIQVLHLLKDVRAFTISQIDNSIRKNRSQSKFYPYRLFRDWYAKNKAIQDYMEDQDIPFLQVGYDELSLHPGFIAQRICSFLEVPFEPSMIDISQSKSHILVGNRMRNKNKQGISYDHRWFVRKEWQIPALIFPQIMNYNQNKVYSNVNDMMVKNKT
jgi:hypothetical protein